MYRNEEEVKRKIEVLNNLRQRSPTNHTEIYSANKALASFNENG